VPYKDKEKQRAYFRKYQSQDKRKAYKRAWYQKNREKMVEYQRARISADPERHKAYFRNRHILKKYGITTEQYEELFQDQGGVCAICGGPPDAWRAGIERLAIDHCHATGDIRGLLCNTCNAGMGILGDTLQHLEAAVAYLKRVEARGPLRQAKPGWNWDPGTDKRKRAAHTT